MDELDRREAEFRGRLSALQEALALLPKSPEQLPTPATGATVKESLNGLVQSFVVVMGERADFAHRLTDMFNETETEFRLIQQQRSARG